MITKVKAEEIVKDLEGQITAILKFHNLELAQTNVTFGDGVDTVFRIECNYIPKTDRDFYLPISNDEIHDGSMALPAYASIIENDVPLKVKVLARRNKKYKIQKMDSDDMFLVLFEEVFLP